MCEAGGSFISSFVRLFLCSSFRSEMWEILYMGLFCCGGGGYTHTSIT